MENSCAQQFLIMCFFGGVRHDAQWVSYERVTRFILLIPMVLKSRGDSCG
jgi:hypothetical protein